MRKFNVRWWAGEDLTQWRCMQACGDFFGPFFLYPDHPLSRELNARIRLSDCAEWNGFDTTVKVIEDRMDHAYLKMCEELDRMYRDCQRGRM
jgi:hypothetical protein